VYEGIIESVNMKKRRVKVKFIGYENEETVDLDELLSSHGEDWREQQVEDASYVLSEDIDKLIDDNSDVFSQISDIQSFDKLSIQDQNNQEDKEKEKKKKKSEDTKKKKSKSDKDKVKEKRKKKIKTEYTLDAPDLGPLGDIEYHPAHPFSDLSHPNPTDSGVFSSIPNLGGTFDHLPNIGPSDPLLNLGEYPNPHSASRQSGYPSLLIPPPPPNPFLAQGSDTPQNEVLQSMLVSWYMAGYHTGFYQASEQNKSKRKKH
jgi:hypothetical protein